MINQEVIDLLERAIEIIKKFNGDPEVPAPPETPPEPLPIGPKHYTIWVPGFTGKEKTTSFTKLNPEFNMIGGFFGYPKNGPSNRYVYTTKYKNNYRGYVWYTPPGFTGSYKITIHFRATRNRSKRQPDVRLKRSGVGTVKAIMGPVQYRKDSAYTSFDFVFDLSPGDYIEMMPGDARSIAFGRMEFKRID